MADEERLVILLEAKLNDLEKQMAKASGVTAKAYREMSLGSKRATTQMENDTIRSTLRINQALAASSAKIGAYGKTMAAGFIAPLVGGLTLAAAINGTKRALEEFGDIADKSAAAGVDAEFFQGIAYQAKLAGIETDALAGAMETFAKNAGLAAEGKGRLVSTLKAMNPELLASIQHAASQEERFKLVADAIAKAKDQAEAAAIASAAFGDQGVKIAAAFKGGAAAIDETMVKARQLGLIVDRDVIARADELGDQFDTTAQIVDLKLRQAFVDLGPVLVWLTNLAGGLAEQIGGAVDNLKPLNEQRRSTIEGTLAGIDLRENDVNPAMTAGLSKEEADALRKPLIEELRRRAMDDLRRQLTGLTPPTHNGLPDVEDVADDLDKVGKSAYDATFALGSTADAVTELSQRWQTAEDMAQSFGQTFLSSMRSGKSAVEALIDSLTGLADQAANMLMQQGIQGLFGLLSGGLTGGLGSIAGGTAIPMGGFIPGLTGPRLFAQGGVTDRPAIFGERGPEAAVPLPDGRSIPVKIQGGRGDKIEINITGSRQDAAPIAREVEAVVHRVITQRRRNEYRR